MSCSRVGASLSISPDIMGLHSWLVERRRTSGRASPKRPRTPSPNVKANTARPSVGQPKRLGGCSAGVNRADALRRTANLYAEHWSEKRVWWQSLRRMKSRARIVIPEGPGTLEDVGDGTGRDLKLSLEGRLAPLPHVAGTPARPVDSSHYQEHERGGNEEAADLVGYKLEPSSTNAEIQQRPQNRHRAQDDPQAFERRLEVTPSEDVGPCQDGGERGYENGHNDRRWTSHCVLSFLPR